MLQNHYQAGGIFLEMNIQFLKWELGEEFVILYIPVSCMTITIQLEI